MSDVANSAKLTTLDYILSVMDTAQSPLDFAIIFHFNHKLDLEALRRGAYSARRRFPTSRMGWTKPSQ